MKTPTSFDIITYSGEINVRGYESICEALSRKQGNSALLVLSTPGGDPHAGFRIARALQHSYEHFNALIPRHCKSAGTLVVIGASTLFMDDMSELGPLDVQVKKGDEVIGRNSGLDILQAVNYLQSQAMIAFREYLLELTRDAGLSTRIASDIASKLTTGLYEPVFAQVDPTRLAEMQRAIEIAVAYGVRLNEKSNNLRTDGLRQLVTGYPSHGFVIDRKEARNIFINVKKPENIVLELGKALYSAMEKNTNSRNPVVEIYSPKSSEGSPSLGEQNEAPSNIGACSAGDAPSSAKVNRDSQDEPNEPAAERNSPAADATKSRDPP